MFFTKKKCPSCSAKNSQKANFCASCGYTFVYKLQPVICYNCHQENPVEAKFCRRCGTGIFQGSSSPSTGSESTISSSAIQVEIDNTMSRIEEMEKKHFDLKKILRQTPIQPSPPPPPRKNHPRTFTPEPRNILGKRTGFSRRGFLGALAGLAVAPFVPKILLPATGTTAGAFGATAGTTVGTKATVLSNEYIIAQALSTEEGRKALAQAMVEPIRTTLEYQNIGRKLLMVNELPQGALARYERDVESVANIIRGRNTIPDKIIEGKEVLIPPETKFNVNNYMPNSGDFPAVNQFPMASEFPQVGDFQ